MQYNTHMNEKQVSTAPQKSVFRRVGNAALIIGGFFIIFYTTYFGTSKWSVTSNIIGGTANAETVGK